MYFNNFLSNCRLFDLDFHGAVCTWSNKTCCRYSPLRKLRRNFRFEAMWIRKLEYKDFLSKVWADCQRSGFLNKVVEFKSESKRWHREYFPNLASKIKEKKEELAYIEQYPSNLDLLQKEQEIFKHLKELFIAEEAFLQQRAKSQLLREGDRNIRFLHVTSTKRHRGIRSLPFKTQMVNENSSPHR